ncbi:anhydro-N-acetylmuramic acid kinase (plasmid) [Shinella yambaruensis]|uniref:anhydro-N-acetylmuramic acid kinase n=1 Tax=Shinella yambaruensis TaxID=415996 RepID=UPI003D7A0757
MVIAIGLNSGSSFDGVDVVAVEIDLAEDGNPSRPQFIAGRSYDWPEAVAKGVLRAFDNKLSIFELCRLNYTTGAVYAECARSLMREQGWKPEDIAVIGYDGQTIYQEPAQFSELKNFSDGEDVLGRWQDGPFPCGLQIGEPAIVAATCNVTTVTQFRPSDHALGGAGAPLMQYLDFVAFRDIGPVLTLNIGGIANCQFAQADRSKMMAFDTGPGNVMLDHATKVLLGTSYDADGEEAAKGTINQPLLDQLLSHDFFKRPVPRSAWRRDFGAEYADEILAQNRSLSAQDILATFTEFTAISITRSIREHVVGVDEVTTVIASGGGVRNGFLMKRLAGHLNRLELVTSDDYGIPPQFKEAIKFATLAYANVNSLANNIPAAGGASSFTILGKTVQPPRLAKVL